MLPVVMLPLLLIGLISIGAIALIQTRTDAAVSAAEDVLTEEIVQVGVNRASSRAAREVGDFVDLMIDDTVSSPNDATLDWRSLRATIGWPSSNQMERSSKPMSFAKHLSGSRRSSRRRSWKVLPIPWPPTEIARASELHLRFRCSPRPACSSATRAARQHGPPAVNCGSAKSSRALLVRTSRPLLSTTRAGRASRSSDERRSSMTRTLLV